MVTEKSFTSIIRDEHTATGHEGKTKTAKKIQETYANITRARVKAFIENCERCAAEKAKKKSTRYVVVRPFLAA